MHQTPQVQKDILEVGRTSYGIQHINPKLVLHIHILQVLNLYTRSFVFILLLHIHPWCATSLISIMISNLLNIFQLNSTTDIQVSSTDLFIL